MEGKAFKEVVKFIISFLVDRTGNDAFDKFAEKRKIIEVLKQDKKNIKQIFYEVEDSEMYILIEEFIMYHVLKTKEFYAVMNLSKEQEENLWEMFEKHIKKENGGEYLNPEYRERIIRCVNLHNEAINEIVMDEKSKIHIKWQQNQNEAINNSIKELVDTLNTETKLQEKDIELDFITVQLESIIKSYRYDINQLRRHQMVCIYGALVVLSLLTVFMPIALERVKNVYGMYIVAILFLIVFVFVIVFGMNNFRKLRMIERDMSRARDLLWKTHYDLYECLINYRYNVITETADNQVELEIH